MSRPYCRHPCIVFSVRYQKLKQRLDAGEVVVLDGGTGTELERRGVAMSPEAWCGPATLGNAELLTQIHLDYINAGSDVITANTYAANSMMLTPAGYGDKIEEIVKTAVDAALRARDLAPEGRNVVVGGSLSHMVPLNPGTDTVDQVRTPPPAQIAESFHQLAQLLKAGGVDHIMLEMMYEENRAQMALQAALATGLPVWFGVSARRNDAGKIISFNLAGAVRFGPYWGEVLRLNQREAIPTRLARMPEPSANGTLIVDIQPQPSFHLRQLGQQLNA